MSDSTIPPVSASFTASQPGLLPANLAAAQNHFGFALLRQVLDQSTAHTNVFLSPFSVSSALTMAMSGTAGSTREALARALQVNSITPAVLDQAMARQLQTFQQNDDAQATIHVANSIWSDQRFTLAPAFVERARTFYQAEAVTLDMTAPEAAPTINRWVREHTHGKITEIVSPEALAGPPPISMVLVNSVYFKGLWETKFNPKKTKPGTFTLSDGTRRQLPLMQQISTSIRYFREGSWQAVSLPYEGYPRRTSMRIFVPDTPTGLPAFLNQLTEQNWQKWTRAFSQQPERLEVDFTLPRFRVMWEQELKQPLQATGLAPVFTPGADFSPMGFPLPEGGYIDAVLHKTYLAVDEESTEAAGITAGMFMSGSGPPQPPPKRVVVRADRPFFCAIVDDGTDVVLFSGAIYDPSAG